MRRTVIAAVALAAAATGTAITLPVAAQAAVTFPVGGYVAPAGRTSAAANLGFSALDVLPDRVDLRGTAPEVGDQGQISSCAAWTIAHDIMGYYANRDGRSGAPYAPLYLYMRSVGSGAPTNGLNPERALAEAQTNGVDTQDDYYQGTTGWQTPPTVAEQLDAKNYKITGWSRLWVGPKQGTAAKTLIQQSLAAGSPVAIGMPVYPDFFRVNSSALYNTTTGTSVGGHMVGVFGYDAEGIWIRNSWGTGWGAQGDAHLSWNFVTTSVEGAWKIGGLNSPAQPVYVAPMVTAVSAVTTTTLGGTEVGIAGANLASVTAVKFGDTAATFHAVRTNGVTKLVATAPRHAAGAVDIVVTNPRGSSPATAADKFTYLPAAPTVTAVAGTASTLGGTLITVTGTDLTGATAVRVGTLAGTSVRVVSPTSLTFLAPAAAAGAVHVTVSTPYGASKTVDADRLTYVAPPAPKVTKLSATSVPATRPTTVTVTGTGLTGATKVTVGDVAVSFTKGSDTQLTAVLPPHAVGTLNLLVTTPSGSSAPAAVNYVR
jgi:hypothetical protein